MDALIPNLKLEIQENIRTGRISWAGPGLVLVVGIVCFGCVRLLGFSYWPRYLLESLAGHVIPVYKREGEWK